MPWKHKDPSLIPSIQIKIKKLLFNPSAEWMETRGSLGFSGLLALCAWGVRDQEETLAHRQNVVLSTCGHMNIHIHEHVYEHTRTHTHRNEVVLSLSLPLSCRVSGMEASPVKSQACGGCLFISPNQYFPTSIYRLGFIDLSLLLGCHSLGRGQTAGTMWQGRMRQPLVPTTLRHADLLV